MSNASLKEQLQAVASQLSESVIKTPPEKKPQPVSAKQPKHAKKRPSDTNQAKKSPQKQKVLANPKPKWLEIAQYGVALLRSYFPAAFKAGEQIHPLKKGIKEDLVKRLSTLEAIATDDKACMVKSLSFYVNTAVYHRKVVEGVTRVDLDGQPAGLVTAEEARYSQEKLEHKKNKGSQPVSKAAPSSSSPSSSETSADGHEKH